MGSDLCVYSRRLRKERFNYDMCAPNGTNIPTYGWLSPSLNLGLRRYFTRRFVVADVTYPFISVDFLFHFSLMLDCRHNKPTGRGNIFVSTGPMIPSVKPISGGTPVHRFLAAPSEPSVKCATIPSTTSALYQAHRLLTDHGD
jgi:hypothetical protein